MPSWVSGYFAIYLAFAGWAFASDIRERTPRRWLSLELICDACLLLSALAYWLPAVRTLVAEALLPLFVAGVAAFLVIGYRSLSKNFPDPEFSRRENFWTATVGVVTVLLVATPLLWWGTVSAVMSRYAAP